MPPFMKADLNGRMGDLLMALGEIERNQGEHKSAVRSMRKAVERFETLGQNEFVAATYNRIALTLIEQGRHRDALSDLAEAEALAAGNEHEAAILSSTLAFKGRCLDAERDTEGAREAMSRALQYAMGCGNEGVAQECEAFLGKTEGASTVDQDAFL